jgi:hypothetical protein
VTRLSFFPPHNSGSRPYTIVTGPDGNLLFTESDLGKIGRITPDGTITDFPIPTPGSGPYGTPSAQTATSGAKRRRAEAGECAREDQEATERLEDQAHRRQMAADEFRRGRRSN